MNSANPNFERARRRDAQVQPVEQTLREIECSLDEGLLMIITVT